MVVGWLFRCFSDSLVAFRVNDIIKKLHELYITDPSGEIESKAIYPLKHQLMGTLTRHFSFHLDIRLEWHVNHDLGFISFVTLFLYRLFCRVSVLYGIS